MVTCSGTVPFTSFSMFGIFLNLLILCPLTAASGPGVFFGMVGCLVSMALVLLTPGLPLLVIWLLFISSGAWVLILLTLLIVGLLLTIGDADDIALEMPEHPNVWTDGSREDFSSLSGFEVAGAGVYLPASELALENLVWGTIEEYGDARLERCRAFLPVPGVMQTVQRAEFWGAFLAHAGILA